MEDRAGRLAAETGLEITVCHLPPGTSKWNKIEHRLFSHISMNWRGRPLTSHEVIVNTIAATTTSTGLTVSAELDTGDYPKGIKIPDRQIQKAWINRMCCAATTSTASGTTEKKREGLPSSSPLVRTRVCGGLSAWESMRPCWRVALNGGGVSVARWIMVRHRKGLVGGGAPIACTSGWDVPMI